MNHIYRSLWSDITRTFVAAAETVRGRGKRSASSSSAEGSVAAMRAGDLMGKGYPATAPPSRESFPVSVLRPLALEQRFMFDGAAVSATLDTVDHAVTDASKALEAVAAAAKPVALATRTEVATEKTVIDAPHAFLSSTDTADVHEIVVVDGTVADYQTLIAGIDPSLPVIILEPDSSGLGEIEMMAQVLSRYQNLDAIHLVTEGRTGAILLGGEALWSGDLQAASPYLKSIGNALKPGGDLMLYGCSVAGNADGQQFIDDLAKAVGGEVDIAASNDRTGPTALGGDWDLEYQTGNVETILPFTLQGMQDISHCLGCVATSGGRGTGANVSASENLILGPDGVTHWAEYVGYPGGWYGIHPFTWILDFGGGTSNSPANNALYTYRGAADFISHIQECSTPSNTSPTFTGSGTTLSVAHDSGATSLVPNLHVSDADSGQTLTWTVTSGPAHGTITWASGTSASNASGSTDVTPSGTITYTPTAGYAGSDSVTFQVSDGSATATRTIGITVTSPAVTSATYDASTGVLVVTGTGMTVGDSINASNLTLVGEGGNTYTLAGSYAVTASSSTTFTVSLDATDKFNVDGLLNKNGTTSAANNTTFNLSAASNWDSTTAAVADTTGNTVTVSNIPTPTITSATYNAGTGVLVVTGTNLVRQYGANNDIDVTKLSLAGQGGSYTLTSNTSKVEITSATSFTVTLGATDKTAVNAKLDADGTASSGLVTYNLAAADDWNGPITGASIADLTLNAVTVSGNNVAPVITEGASTSVTMSEDGSPTAFNLTLNATDSEQAGSALTWSIASAAGHGTASVSGTGSSQSISYTPTADYNGSDSFVVQVSDGAGGTDTLTVNVTVAPVNDAPTDIALGTSSINQTAAVANATVGTLSATDPDSGDSHSFSLVSGSGDTDNASFAIVGNALKIASGSTLSAGTYQVRVRATDSGSLGYDKAFTVTVNDDAAPTLTSATPADNATGIAPSANIALTFSENIAAGTGNITLVNVSTGTTVETFNIATGTGDQGGTVSISGAVLTLDPSANLAEATQYAVRIAGTAIEDSSHNAFAGISNDTSYNFSTGVSDSAAPTLLAINRSSPSTETHNASSVDFVLRFNEAVTGLDSSDFTAVASSGLTGATVASVAGNGTATITVTVNGYTGTGTLGLGFNAGQNITDIAGNAFVTATPADSEHYAIDRSAPTLVSFTRLGHAAESTRASSAQFLAVFSESVSGVDAADFDLSGSVGTAIGDAGNIAVSGSGATRTITVSNLAGNGSLGLNLNASASITDAAGNSLVNVNPTTGVDEGYVRDATAPSAVAITRTGNATTNGSSVSFNVVFNETVTQVGTGDFSLTTTGTASGSIASVTGSGDAYTVTVNNVSGDGTLGLAFSGGQDIVDSAGNAFAGLVPSLSETYAVDHSLPTVTSIHRAGVNQLAAGASADAIFTVVFSEAVTGVSSGDFTVTGSATGSISSVSSTDGKVFQVRVALSNPSVGQTVGLNFTGSASDALSQASTAPHTGDQVYTIGGTLLNEGALDQAALDALLGVNRNGLQQLVDATGNATEVVIIDSRVPGLAEQVASNLRAGADVWLLDANSSAIGQISTVLARYHGLNAVHLISHGGEGALYLGAETLSTATLAAQATTLAAWGNALSASGDFLLYGCDVAKGTAGQAFINAFAAATHADVAASDDLTGASWLGGDWVLEAETGPVEEVSFASRFYSGVLGSINVTDYSQTYSGTNGVVDYFVIDVNLGSAGGGYFGNQANPKWGMGWVAQIDNFNVAEDFIDLRAWSINGTYTMGRGAMTAQMYDDIWWWGSNAQGAWTIPIQWNPSATGNGPSGSYSPEQTGNTVVEMFDESMAGGYVFLSGINPDNLTSANFLLPSATPVNTNPTISDVSNQTANENSPISGIAVTVGDAETAAASLILSGSSSNTTLIPNGNIVVSGTGANRTVTITPAANQTGTATITLTVTDGSSATSTDTFTVTVNDVDPIISNATVSVNENAAVGTAVTTLTATDDTNGLTYAITGGTGQSLFDINASTGAITVKNGANLDYESSNSYSLTVTVDDEDGDSTADSTATITINLTDVDEPEIAVTGNSVDIVDGDGSPVTTNHTDFGSTATSGGTVSRTFTISNTGTAALTLGAVSVGGANAADFTVTAQPATTVAANGSTTFTVEFNPSVDGLRSATLSVSTNDGNENPFNFSIQGTGTPNTAPTSSDDRVVLTGNTSVVLTGTDFGTFADADGDALSSVRIMGLPQPSSAGSLEYDSSGAGAWTAVSVGQDISAADIAAGRLRFLPAAGGANTVQFKVSDGTAVSEATYTLTLAPSNTASIPSATKPQAVFQLETDPAYGLSDLHVAAAPTSGLQRGLTMPLGQLGFTVNGVAAGGTANITLSVDSAYGMSSFVKQNLVTNQWVKVAGTTTVVGGKTVISFSLQDGGVFDADRLANGVIVDPGITAFDLLAPMVAENTTWVSDLSQVMDLDALHGQVTYAVTGGADGSLFSVDPATGVLRFQAAPDHETPTDQGDTAANNTYVVQITASGGAGGSVMQELVVTVLNDTGADAKIANLAGDTTELASNVANYIDAGDPLTELITIDGQRISGSSSLAFFNGGYVLVQQVSGTHDGVFSLDPYGAVSGADGVLSAGEEVSVASKAIGTVDGILDGQDGRDLRINLYSQLALGEVQTSDVEQLVANLMYRIPSQIEGERVFSLTLNDGANNYEAVSFSVTGPVVSSPSVTGVSGDSGTSSTDGITLDKTLVIRGTATANASLAVLRDGTQIGTATADAAGNWSLDYTATSLDDGHYLFTARVLDTASATQSGASSAFAVTIDTVAPTTTIATVSFSSDNGPSSTDFITSVTSQTISGTLSANLQSGETVQVSLDNGLNWTAATASTGSNTWSLAGQTLVASSTLKVKVTDTAGNDGAVHAQAYVLDNAGPVLSSALPVDNATGVSPTNNIVLTFNEGIRLGTTGTITLRDITGNGANSVIIDVANHGGQLIVNGAVLTINPGSNLLTTNQYAVQLSGAAVEDRYGNAYAGISDSTTLNFTTGTVDSSAPVATLVDVADPTQPNAGTVSIHFNEQVQNVDISDFTLTRDTGSGPQTISLAGLSVGGSGSSYTLDLSSVTTTEGVYVLTLNPSNITDTSGNALAAAVSDTFTIDTTAPTGVAIVRASTENPTDAGSVSFTVVFSEEVSGVSSDDFTLSGTATSGASVDSTVTRVSGSVYTVTVNNVSGDGTLGLNLKSSGTGIADSAGNAIATGTTGQQYTIDHTTPGVVAINRNAAQVTSANTVTFTVSFDEAVANVDASDFDLVTTGTASGSITGISGSGSVYTLTVGGVAGDGTLSIALKNSGTGIADLVSNAIAAGFSNGAAYTIDNTQPVITASQSFNLPENMGAGFVIGQARVSEANAVTGWRIASGDSNGYFAIDSQGVITLTSAGAAAGAAARDYEITPNLFTLGLIATDVAGNDASAQAVTITVLDEQENSTPTVSAGGTTAFTEQTPIAVASSLALNDVDGDADWNGGTLKVQITGNNQADDRLTLGTTQTSDIWLDTSGNKLMANTTQIGSASAASASNGTAWTFTFNGNATSTLVQEVARAVKFDNQGNKPATSSRTVTFTATDKNAAQAAATQTVTLSAVNDAPTVTAGATLAYTENATAAVIDATLTLADADDTQLVGATVTISNPVSGDTLGFMTQNGISGSYSNGVLTLSGTATVAQYQAALRSVTFSSSSDDPTANGARTSRSVSWAVTDANSDGAGAQSSVGATSTVNVSAVNDVPVLVTPSAANYTDTTGADAFANTSGTLVATDAEGRSLVYGIDGGTTNGSTIIAAITYDISKAGSNGTLYVNSTTGAYVFVPDAVAINALSANSSETFTITSTDGDQTGHVNYTVNLAGANDTPVVTSLATATVTENAPASTVVYTVMATDADAGQALSYSLSGTDAGLFDIDPSTGGVTLKSSANHEVKASYSFNVVVTDSGTDSQAHAQAVVLTAVDANDPVTGSLTIDGTARQGEPLTVTDTLADEDGITGKTYQWYADGQPIDGATQASLTPGQDQVGKIITVKASYTDVTGRHEEVTSAATPAVVNLNDPTTGQVTLTGESGVGQTLTASNDLADLDGLGTVTYQWQYKDSNGQWQDITLISGQPATGSSYTVESQHASRELRIKASFTDGQGTAETVYSASVTAGGLPPASSTSAVTAASTPVTVEVNVADTVTAPASTSTSTATFISTGTVNAIQVLGVSTSATVTSVSAPTLVIPEAPVLTTTASVVSLGVGSSTDGTASGLRAMEASRDVVIERGESASFSLPAGTFVHTNASAQVSLSARLADGRPLPDYVKFNPTTGTFTVEAGAGEKAEQLQVEVKAVDDKGQTANTTLVIKLKEKARNSSAIEVPVKLGKPALSEQIRLTDKLTDRPAGTLAGLAALSKAFAVSHAERSFT